MSLLEFLVAVNFLLSIVAAATGDLQKAIFTILVAIFLVLAEALLDD